MNHVDERGRAMFVDRVVEIVGSVHDRLSARLDCIDKHLGFNSKPAGEPRHPVVSAAPVDQRPVLTKAFGGAKPHVRYTGPFQAGKTYRQGDGVLVGSTAYVCKFATCSVRPTDADEGSLFWERL